MSHLTARFFGTRYNFFYFNKYIGVLGGGQGFLFFAVFFTGFTVHGTFTTSCSILGVYNGGLRVMFFFGKGRVFDRGGQVNATQGDGRGHITIDRRVVFFGNLHSFVVRVFCRHVWDIWVLCRESFR